MYAYMLHIHINIINLLIQLIIQLETVIHNGCKEASKLLQQFSII